MVLICTFPIRRVSLPGLGCHDEVKEIAVKRGQITAVGCSSDTLGMWPGRLEWRPGHAH